MLLSGFGRFLFELSTGANRSVYVLAPILANGAPLNPYSSKVHNEVIDLALSKQHKVLINKDN